MHLHQYSWNQWSGLSSRQMLMEIPSMISWVDGISNLCRWKVYFCTCIYTAWALLPKFFNHDPIKHFPIQIWNCIQFRKTSQNSTLKLLLHKKLNWTFFDLWSVISGLQWLGHSNFTDCILCCTFVIDVCVRVCVSLCVIVTATSGSRLPIGLCNDNDEFSQLVRPRTLIGPDHQV